jgi:NAD+ kinase
MTSELDAIFSGKYLKQSRSLIEARLFRDAVMLDTGNALNDVFISRGASGRLMEFELFVDNDFVYRQRADGLIVSTPTGSTAYALSANGPIVHPTVKGLLLVPLYPHSLSCRPLLIPDTAVIKCRLIDAPDAYLHYDGQRQVSINAGDSILIQQPKDQVDLILPENYQYFSVLRHKLHWSESPAFDDHE